MNSIQHVRVYNIYLYMLILKLKISTRITPIHSFIKRLCHVVFGQFECEDSKRSNNCFSYSLCIIIKVYNNNKLYKLSKYEHTRRLLFAC